MKKIFVTIAALMLCMCVNAQSRPENDTTAGKKTNANDSIGKMSEALLPDDADRGKTADKQIYDDDNELENDIEMVKIYGGTIIIIKDKHGNVKKKVYESKKRGIDRIFGESYLDLGFNRIDVTSGNSDFPKLNEQKSVSFAWYPMVGINVVKDYFGILTGLGYESLNFRFKDGMTLKADDNGYVRGIPASAIINSGSVSKSKLTAHYINLPVMLKGNIYVGKKKGKYRDFMIAGGINFGINIGSHTKIVYYDGSKNKYKNKDDFSLAPFRYGLTARAGFGSVGFYVDYYMSSMFVNGEGPETYPYLMGVYLRLY